MSAIPLPWKIAAALAIVVAFGAVYVWGRIDGNEAMKAEYAAASLKAQQRADELANELIIAQAAAMAVTEKKVISYVDRIRTVQAPDTACAADERMRLGSRGVRDLIRGGPGAERGTPPAVQGPGVGARP